ncbi:MAG: leucine-rich repeat protein [Muribaculaceae bacterium]
MKRILLALLLALNGAASYAYDFTSGLFIYNIISDDEVEVAGYDYRLYDGTVNIPSSVSEGGKTYTVTKIGDTAFAYCIDLTSVTIPNTVNSIDERAFYYCSDLTSITIPDAVTYIGKEAFARCSGLTSLSIPGAVTSIGDEAFYYCSGLTSITIPDAVTYIGKKAFAYCTGLTSITIPKSVTSIGYAAFSHCNNLTSIEVSEENTNYDSREGCNAIIETATNTLSVACMNTIIPNSVTSIGAYAFYDCIGLTSITIPNSVSSIGENAFAFCIGLTSITIPNTVTSIGAGAFSCCIVLTSITIPNAVTSIGDDVFSVCKGLTSITIPNSVTSIGAYAFHHCSGLTSLTIPTSVSSIGYDAFSGCSGLTSIEVSEENTNYDSREGCNAIIETATNTLTVGCMNTVIPNSVTSIGASAFAECTGLTSITIPNSVSSIGNDAFNLSGLTSLTIPASVASIGAYAFAYCSALTSLTIHNSVASIGAYAFECCTGLTSITIPNSVVSIGNSAFKESTKVTEITLGNNVANIGVEAFAGMQNVVKITSLNPTPPVCAASSVFKDINKDECILYVPAGAKTPYAETGVWSDFTNIIELSPINVETITLDTESVTMPIGSSTTITYTIAPDNATIQTLNWEVENPDIASLTDNGDGTVTVNALAVGEAIITAKATDGSNVTATCAVNVGISSVEGINAEGIKIVATTEGIEVKGAPSGSLITVYTATGILVYHGYDSLIPIRNHGVYFVSATDLIAKVVL